MTNTLKNNGLFSVYLLGFLFAFHTALPTYINSSFLNTFISEKMIGIIYIIASIFTICCFLFMPLVLKKFGNYHTALFLIFVEILVLLGLSFFDSFSWLIPLFIANLVAIPLIYFSTDIFLEGYSSNRATGRIRGIYLTSVNLAWAISPLVSGLILVEGDYSRIYFASFIFMLPVLLILVSRLKRFKDSPYEATHVWQTIKVISRSRDLRNIFMANWFLFFFYSLMTIYTPLYLSKNIGFSWGEIGITFSIMLLPFVLFQFILGRLADKKWGEKEMLSLGFIIIAISTSLISFITDKNIVLWATILFVTRIGASIIEVMCDTYFFKKVDSLNANIISFFRMSNPIAYIVAPLFAVIMLNFFSLELQYLFLALGLIMFIGLKFSLSLEDTK
jgi:MFS family permease